MDSLISKIGILGIDHIAVTTNDFIETLHEYLSLPSSRLLRGPGWNEKQGVNYAFVKTSEGVIIEVLGSTDGSPIHEHVKRGGGVYHFCYLVRDIKLAVEAIKDNKGRIIVEPVPDIAFDGREISFAFHPYLGLFEVIAALPDLLILSGKKVAYEWREIEKIPDSGRLTTDGSPAEKDDNRIEHQLIELLRRELKTDDPSTIRQASLGSLSTWDSLGHIKLIMAVENAFDVTVASGDLYRLRSFNDILAFLKNRPLISGDED